MAYNARAIQQQKGRVGAMDSKHAHRSLAIAVQVMQKCLNPRHETRSHVSMRSKPRPRSMSGPCKTQPTLSRSNPSRGGWIAEFARRSTAAAPPPLKQSSSLSPSPSSSEEEEAEDIAGVLLRDSILESRNPIGAHDSILTPAHCSCVHGCRKPPRFKFELVIRCGFPWVHEFYSPTFRLCGLGSFYFIFLLWQVEILCYAIHYKLHTFSCGEHALKYSNIKCTTTSSNLYNTKIVLPFK